MVLDRERHCRQCDGFPKNPWDALHPQDVLDHVGIAQLTVLGIIAISEPLSVLGRSAYQNVFARNVAGCEGSWGGHPETVGCEGELERPILGRRCSNFPVDVLVGGTPTDRWSLGAMK